MLEAKGLNVYYGESIILRDVGIEVKPGQIVCLMGRNGVGKTTLLKTIMGLLKPKDGKILLGGEDITNRTPDFRAKKGIGYSPQGRDIFPQLSVEDNLTLSLGIRGGSDRIPEEIFTLFPVLKDMLARKGGDLSGGQQQQLAIARALVAGPKLLLLDEPTEGIQPSVIKDIANVIHTIKNRGDISVLLVEQYLDFALDLADYYYIMQKGQIVLAGPVKEMKEDEVRKHLVI